MGDNKRNGSFVELEVIGDLRYAPSANLPFGETHYFGNVQRIVYDQQCWQGYEAGAVAHQNLVEHQPETGQVLLDVNQFKMILDEMRQTEQYQTLGQEAWSVFCAFFIAGWIGLFLGVVSLEDASEGDDV